MPEKTSGLIVGRRRLPKAGLEPAPAPEAAATLASMAWLETPLAEKSTGGKLPQILGWEDKIKTERLIPIV